MARVWTVSTCASTRIFSLFAYLARRPRGVALMWACPLMCPGGFMIHTRVVFACLAIDVASGLARIVGQLSRDCRLFGGGVFGLARNVGQPVKCLPSCTLFACFGSGGGDNYYTGIVLTMCLDQPTIKLMYKRAAEPTCRERAHTHIMDTRCFIKIPTREFATTQGL